MRICHFFPSIYLSSIIWLSTSPWCIFLISTIEDISFSPCLASVYVFYLNLIGFSYVHIIWGSGLVHFDENLIHHFSSILSDSSILCMITSPWSIFLISDILIHLPPLHFFFWFHFGHDYVHTIWGPGLVHFDENLKHDFSSIHLSSSLCMITSPWSIFLILHILFLLHSLLNFTFACKCCFDRWFPSLELIEATFWKPRLLHSELSITVLLMCLKTFWISLLLYSKFMCW